MKRVVLANDHSSNYIKAYRDGRLPILNIWGSGNCDLKCIYCATGAGEPDEGELSARETIRVIDEARSGLGCDIVSINGKGEPIIDPNFPEVLEHIRKSGMKVTISTNGRNITPKIARALKKAGANVVMKLPSHRPEVYEELSGVRGSFRRAREGLMNLVDAGFGGDVKETKNEIVTDLSLMYLLAKPAFDSFDVYLGACQRFMAFPMIDGIVADGRVIDNMNMDELALSPEDDEVLYMRFRDVMGYKYEGEPNKNCPIRWGIFVDNQGNVRADMKGNSCDVPYKDTVGNVREHRLPELWGRLEGLREKSGNVCSVFGGTYNGNVFPKCYRMQETQEVYRRLRPTS